MKRFAVFLSGCGVYDGSEIHEAVMTMLAIKKLGAEYALFAPDKAQHDVVDHLTGKATGERRNVLTESARIARGQIAALSEFRAAGFDAIVLPGGFGAAKNLCTFAVDGPTMQVDSEVAAAVRAMVAAGKPVGALCIAPVILAKLLGDGVEVTVGQDEETGEALRAMGAKPVMTDHTEVAIDPKRKVFTGPCYMLDANIVQIQQGAENVVRAMLEAM